VRCAAGSAAIHGLRGKKNVHVFILYPKGRVSEIQERQMTTVLDKNVHCISVENVGAYSRAVALTRAMSTTHTHACAHYLACGG
jgi:threonine synthase